MKRFFLKPKIYLKKNSHNVKTRQKIYLAKSPTGTLVHKLTYKHSTNLHTGNGKALAGNTSSQSSQFPMSRQSKTFCFTINNPCDQDIQGLSALGQDTRVVYLIYGKETGTNGTFHLQGFVLFGNKIRWSTVKSLIPRAHLECTRGSIEQNIQYCSKDGDTTEFGTRPNAPSGRKSDLDHAIEWLDEFINDNGRAPTEQEIARENPQAFVKYRNFAQLALLRAPPPSLQDGECNDWQLELERILLAPCTNDREINFFVDRRGGKGKSWFTRYFLTKYPERTQILMSGGYADMAYALDSSKTVFLINVPRGGMEYLQYRFLESLKDRFVFSTKYESRLKIINEIPHIIVFCNEEPDPNKMTGDRYTIKKLS